MILYRLRCPEGHEFEAWFRDSSGFDTQTARGDVGCPFCGSAEVEKAPMAPSVARNLGERASEGRAHEIAEQILRAVKDLREHVEDNCDYVGDEFADEARRIHYGEADERDIYGEVTLDDAAELEDEGIPFMPLPKIPSRRN